MRRGGKSKEDDEFHVGHDELEVPVKFPGRDIS